MRSHTAWGPRAYAPDGVIWEGVCTRRFDARILRQRSLGRRAAQRGAGVVAHQGLAQTLDQLDVDLRVGACACSQGSSRPFLGDALVAEDQGLQHKFKSQH